MAKGLVNIDFDKSTSWMLFFSGMGIGFFGFSVVLRLFTYITNAISGWLETKFAVYLTRAQKDLTGAAIFLVGGIVIVKLLGTLLTFILGFIIGLGMKFIFVNHLGILPETDAGAYFGMNGIESLDP